jgi:hypothetical protein
MRSVLDVYGGTGGESLSKSVTHVGNQLSHLCIVIKIYENDDAKDNEEMWVLYTYQKNRRE